MEGWMGRADGGRLGGWIRGEVGGWMGEGWEGGWGRGGRADSGEGWEFMGMGNLSAEYPSLPEGGPGSVRNFLCLCCWYTDPSIFSL